MLENQKRRRVQALLWWLLGQWYESVKLAAAIVALARESSMRDCSRQPGAWAFTVAILVLVEFPGALVDQVKVNDSARPLRIRVAGGRQDHGTCRDRTRFATERQRDMPPCAMSLGSAPGDPAVSSTILN